MENLVNYLKVGGLVVYPSVGIGKIDHEEKDFIAGTEIDVYVISFPNQKMKVKVPKMRANSSLRDLCSKEDATEALSVLKGKRLNANTMWIKKSKECQTKINSGNLKLIAEVLRDLYRHSDETTNATSNNANSSPQKLFELAKKRFVEEYSLVMDITDEQANNVIMSTLCYR